MAMPSFLAANPLASLDPETLILEGLEAFSPGGVFPSRNVGMYDFISLKYPEDIEHYFMHGHYINFYVNAPVWGKYWEKDGKTGISSYSYEGMPEVGGLLGSIGITSNGYSIKEVERDGTPIKDPTSAAGAVNHIRTQRISQAISLYIPDTMSYSSQIQYEHTSARQMGASLLNSLDKTLSGYLSKVTNSKLVQGISGAMNLLENLGKIGGVTVNDQMLVLFRQVGLREFSYDFFFTPKSPKEAESVQQIIRAFRFHAHPEAVLDYGLFYIAPGTFDIEFMHRGSRNTKIHQVSTCVLTGYDVDYAPMGWSTHVDGMPIQTRMSLHFTETQVVTKQDIEAGY